MSFVICEIHLQYNIDIHKDLLFCQPLLGRTTRMDVFQKCDDFFTKVGLFRTNCVGDGTDEATTMTEHTARFYARVQSASDTPITFKHCIIHREAIAAKTTSPDLNVVVKDAVKGINFIKSRALNTRNFANLCGEMESEFTTLLLHC